MTAPASRPRKPVVCIMCLYAWPVFDPASGGAFGGSEVRIAGIARGLAKRGHLDVKMVVWDHGQGARTTREGIEFIAWPEKAPANEAPSVEEAVVDEAPPPPPPRLSRFRATRWTMDAYDRGGAQRALAYVPWLGIMGIRWGVRRFFRTKERVYWGIYMRARYRVAEWRRQRMAAARIDGYLVPRSRFALMDSIAPDVTVVHGATGVTAEIVAWCVARRRASVFLSGSDLDFLPEHRQGVPTLYGDPGRVAAYAVEKATVHVVQTPAQQERLRSLYGREGIVARNPIDLTCAFPKEDEGSVLWVGKSDAVKRPELALEVARRLPHRRFVLIMNVSNPELFATVSAGARAAGNVEVVPWVAFDEVERYFARAAVFLSTSRIEGFPNTFLQAAKYEVPVASLAVDPGEMLERHGAGVHARGNMELLTAELESLLSDERRRREVGARARAYVEQHHDQSTVLDQLEQVVLNATRR